MSEGQKSSGAVTVLSIVGLVFGLIGMMGSFIPCLGSLAFFVGLPAALISGLALFIARANNGSRTFPIVALVISLIGVVVSGTQYFSIISAGKRAQQAMEPAPPTKFEERALPMQVQQPAPAPVKPPVDTSGITIVQQDSNVPANSDEAKAQFVNKFRTMYSVAPMNKKGEVVINNIIQNKKEWVKIPIILEKGTLNTITVHAGRFSTILYRTTKPAVHKNIVSGKSFTVDGEKDTNGFSGRWNFTFSDTTNGSGGFDPSLDFELSFQPSYMDYEFEIYVPAAYKADYKITLRNARVNT